VRYVVFGVGRQGLAIVHDLLTLCGAERVEAFDVDAGAGERLRSALGDRARQVTLHVTDPSDASSHDQIIERIRGSACVLSALPYALNPLVTRLCLRAGVPMCDLGGNPDAVAEQRGLCDSKGLVAPDCGLAPGLNNIFAAYLRGRYGIVSAKAYCGGNPAEPPQDNPLRYKLFFSPGGLISEYSGMCAVLRGGRVEYVEALTGHEEIDGGREAFYTSNNSPLTFEAMRDLGLTDYEYKTVRWHGHLDRVLLLKRLGFFRGDRRLDGVLAECLLAQEWLRFERGRDVDEVLLCVEGKTADGKRMALSINVRGTASFAAMELTTSWGITIPATWIASGAKAAGKTLPKGCLPPERVVDPAWAVEQLRRRVEVREETMKR
jgi:saccharopine dehydrogenase-like NADP-dependent oxidoreductase